MTPAEHLSPASLVLYEQLVAELTPSERRALVDALVARDAAEAAECIVRRDGVVIEGQFGTQANPAVKVALDNRRAFLDKVLGIIRK